MQGDNQISIPWYRRNISNISINSTDITPSNFHFRLPNNPPAIPVTEPVTQPVTEPVTQPVTQPVTEPATEPNTNPQPNPNPTPFPYPNPLPNPWGIPKKPEDEKEREPWKNPFPQPQPAYAFSRESLLDRLKQFTPKTPEPLTYEEAARQAIAVNPNVTVAEFERQFYRAGKSDYDIISEYFLSYDYSIIGVDNYIDKVSDMAIDLMNLGIAEWKATAIVSVTGALFPALLAGGAVLGAGAIATAGAGLGATASGASQAVWNLLRPALAFAF